MFRSLSPASAKDRYCLCNYTSTVTLSYEKTLDFSSGGVLVGFLREHHALYSSKGDTGSRGCLRGQTPRPVAV